MLKKIQILLQYLLPKLWITYLIGLIASWRGGWITHCIILLFVRAYKINIKESTKPNITDYATFNEFFTRKLQQNIRPIDSDPFTLIMPVDGIISQIGKINDTHIFQIKDCPYRLDGLLAGHDNMINYFRNGNFIITYIPPSNCHRVYMPCTGTLREMLYIPGELFSVHPNIIKNIPNILSRNERIICLFDTNFGHMVQILIGATIVGSVETIWSGTITPPREGIVKHWHYPSSEKTLKITTNNNYTIDEKIKDSIVLHKGHEMGLFKLGSTVINLFNNKTVFLNQQLKPYDITRIGMPLAQGQEIKKTI